MANFTLVKGASLAEINSKVADAQAAQAGAEVARDVAESAANLSAMYAPAYYDDVATFFAASTVWPVGTRINARTGEVWDVVTAGIGDFDHPVSGIGITVLPGISGISLTAFALDWSSADMSALLNAVFAKAASNNVPVDLRGLTVRCESTLHRNGVSKIISHGSTIYFPASGTYDPFLLDDGVTPLSGSPGVCFNVQGSTFSIDGILTIKGAYLANFNAAARANVNMNAALGAILAPCEEMCIPDELRIEGFENPIYVPTANGTTMGSRQFARINGVFRTKFCLAPLGQMGAQANGMDDCFLSVIHTSRCGGFGGVASSYLQKSAWNIGSIFFNGLMASDAEASTISVTAGSATATLSAAHDYLAAGDWIAIPDASLRQADGASTNLVARVAAVSGTTVTLDEKTIPTVSVSGLAWYYRPPLIELANAWINAAHIYQEGYQQGIKLSENSGIRGLLKGGGSNVSGRYGALISTTGVAQIDVAVERTPMQSVDLHSIIAIAMIRDVAGGREVAVSASVRATVQEGDFAVLPIVGVNATDFWTESGNRVSRYGTAQHGHNLVIDWPARRAWGYLDASGAFTDLVQANDADFSGSVVVDGNVTVGYASKIGTIQKNVTVSTSATLIYDDAVLEPNALYEISGKISTGIFGAIAVITVGVDGTCYLNGQTGSGMTFSVSGTGIYAARSSGTGTCNFSLMRRA